MNLPLAGILENLRQKRRRAEWYKRAAREIRDRGRVVALTGAGISVDSGIPDFRDTGGLWERFDPMEYAHIDAFRQTPEKTWLLFQEMQGLVDGAQPNPGHVGLSRLEALGFLCTVITQNVDGLHQRAGNSDVIEYHGNSRSLVCLCCERRVSRDGFGLEQYKGLPRCTCGAVLKPDVVLFGEPIPRQSQFRAQVAARQCGVMLVVGTSAMVYPASEIPQMAKNSGALIVEVNVRETVLTSTVTDIFLEGSASVVFPRLLGVLSGMVQ